MTTNPNEERDAAEALIPWYATGKLDEPDRRQVEEALMRWPELREGLRLAEEEQAETIATNESLGRRAPARGRASRRPWRRSRAGRRRAPVLRRRWLAFSEAARRRARRASPGSPRRRRW